MSRRGKARGVVASPTAPDSAFSIDTLTLELRARLGALSGTRLCVAFSGGLDSSALLHALSRLARRERLTVRAVHIHHHLHEAADRHAQAAARQARRWRVPCRVIDAPVRPAAGESLEAAARAVRYAALAAEIAPGERLLTAHHQEDQLETLLLALMRGSGVRGLAAMRPVTPWHDTLLVRPLLSVPRAALEAYARDHALAFCEDPTNRDPRFDRNFLRLQVVPLIRERWPAAAATVSRSAALLAEARELLEQQARADLASARDGAALSVSGLLCLSEVRRRNALRHWIGERGLMAPDHRRLRELATRMLSARADATPSVRWRGGELRRHGDRLLAVSAAPATLAPQEWNWQDHAWLSLANGGQLGLVRDPNGDVLLSALPAQLRVSYRRGGERLRGHAGRIVLKDLLQASGLTPWQRPTVPLLGDGERILAIADLWLDPAIRVRGRAPAAEERGRFRWRAPAH